MITPSRNRRGFTAAELLTAIAIIAVLIGLLFPVAGAVRPSSSSPSASGRGAGGAVCYRGGKTVRAAQKREAW